jgi:hypothetical protein
METTTIVVLSVASTLVIIGLIAMVNGLRKAHKQINHLLETSNSSICHYEEIHNQISEEHENLNRIICTLENNIHLRVDEAASEAEKKYDGIHRRIDETLQQADQQYVNISRHAEETWKENQSDLDRRFDRLYSKIYEALPQLKEKTN